MLYESIAPIPADEAVRLADVRALRILDTPTEEPYDGIVEGVAALFEVPVALLTVIDAEEQWFKASVGTPFLRTPRALSFCETTIALKETFVVDDLRLDPRFIDHPFVVGELGVRFYAGVPLISNRGQAVGTLCLLDTKPRSFDASRYRLLERLAHGAVEALEARRTIDFFLDVFAKEQDEAGRNIAATRRRTG